MNSDQQSKQIIVGHDENFSKIGRRQRQQRGRSTSTSDIDNVDQTELFMFNVDHENVSGRRRQSTSILGKPQSGGKPQSSVKPQSPFSEDIKHSF